MIVDELVETFTGRAEPRAVTDVRIGLGYTAVCLDEEDCGLAYTFRNETAPGCNVLREAGTLSGRPASELLQWATGTEIVKAAVGIATLNALVEPPGSAQVSDILEVLQLVPDDVVGMVGYFAPVATAIRKQAASLHIFERRPDTGNGILPDWAAPMVLPECDVVILSATSLINRTLDALLGHCQGAREVVLLGPSTPLLPDFFRRFGITLLSGVEVVDPQRLLRLVSEGGGTRSFGGAVRKVNLRVPE